MDQNTLLAAISIVKKIPGTAAERAETAQAAAESAAELAQQHSMGVSVNEHTITFTPLTDGN